MDNLRERLTDCFLAVFPDLDRNEIPQATSSTVSAWDSVAGVTLLAIVEEEFGISIEVQDLSTTSSYQGYLEHLYGTFGNGNELARAVSALL